MEETQNEVKECPFCAQKINIRAKKCPFCREAIDPVLIMLEKQQNTQGREINITLDSGRPTVHIPKNRTSYILLGIFLGALGVHNFYAGYQGRGLAQLLITIFLGWTILFLLITSLWAIIEVCVVTKDADGINFQ
ncbi:NINE protein [Victivallis vadensis]|uniref:NINE protein n=2 Tax=Victivallis vadensis TaxID=172901 RepID=UPI0001C01AC6|nr:NINE protein [Victivallis vadensis]